MQKHAYELTRFMLICFRNCLYSQDNAKMVPSPAFGEDGAFGVSSLSFGFTNVYKLCFQTDVNIHILI